MHNTFIEIHSNLIIDKLYAWIKMLSTSISSSASVFIKQDKYLNTYVQFNAKKLNLCLN